MEQNRDQHSMIVGRIAARHPVMGLADRRQIQFSDHIRDEDERGQEVLQELLPQQRGNSTSGSGLIGRGGPASKGILIRKCGCPVGNPARPPCKRFLGSMWDRLLDGDASGRLTTSILQQERTVHPRNVISPFTRRLPENAFLWLPPKGELSHVRPCETIPATSPPAQ